MKSPNWTRKHFLLVYSNGSDCDSQRVIMTEHLKFFISVVSYDEKTVDNSEIAMLQKSA